MLAHKLGREKKGRSGRNTFPTSLASQGFVRAPLSGPLMVIRRFVVESLKKEDR
jgi:hypothetical protein